MNIKITLNTVIILILFLISQVSAAELILKGRVEEMYDDNFNSSGTTPESEWLTNLVVGASVKSETKGLDLELSGNVYQQLLIKNSENNKNYQDLTLNLNKSFTETSAFKLNDVFQHYPESKSFGTLFGRSDTTAGYISNSFTTGISFFVTKELFFDINYNNAIMNSSSEIMTDSILNSPSAIIGYSFDSANIIKIGYVYSHMEYNDGTKTIGNRGYAEYEKHFTNQFRTVLQGGYDFIQMNEGNSKSPKWLISLIDNVDKNNQLDITFLKERTISNITNDTFDNWRITGTLKREISMRTGISLALFYGKGNYFVSGSTNQLLGCTGALTFTVSEFVNFYTGYSHIWNKSTTPGSYDITYHKNQYTAGISATY